MLSTIQLPCDLCVIGGGISDMAAAISAAREGLDVILMHERPVLGGNASSEIRMWISGARGRNNRETGIVEEIELENMYRNPTKSFAIWDTVLFDFMRRDELVALAAGAWDYVKNSGNFNAKNWDLDFLGFLPGKRESRRMCGEYMITQRDVSDNRVFDDEIAFGGWPLDDHFPDGFYHRGTPNTDIQTPAPYSIPYRSLYSKNVDNLFFAGRNISMTHMAMSSIRVMGTCALLGEAVDNLWLSWHAQLTICARKDPEA